MTTEEQKTNDEVLETTETVIEHVEQQETSAPSEEPITEVTAEQSAGDAQEKAKEHAREDSRNRRGRGGYDRRGGRGRRPMRREKPEFEQKIISLRRVTRVMAGGRRFSFSAAVVIGDRRGRVGFGIGKAGDTAQAIDKAVRMAKKDMITVKRTETNSIPHDSRAKYKASQVLLRPVSGKGLAAGGAVRVVLEMAGVDEVGGKLLSRSKNNINNAKATLLALEPFRA